MQRMKWTTFGATLVAAALAWAAELPSQLGIGVEQAQRMVLDGVQTGNVYPGSARGALQAASPEQRAAWVEATLGWVKTYAQSAQFAAAYASAREQSKPMPPPTPERSVDDELRARKAEMEQQFEEGRKNAAALPAEQRAAVEAGLAQAREAMAAMEKDPQMAQMQRQALEADRTQRQQEYDKALSDWEQRYPVDPKALIKQRLQEFLALSGTVDFAAATKADGNKVRFVNPEYERKPANWKLCFRAGKPAVDAARAFATSWEKEL